MSEPFSIDLDYPFTPRARWGHGRPAHPELHALIDGGRDRYAQHLSSFLEFSGDLTRIPRDGDDTLRWVNWYLGPIDCLSLYGFVRAAAPAYYVEIGSGTSTAFARRAIDDAGAATRIVSIDPNPRAEIDALCDRVVRAPFEDVVVDDLGVDAGDILFFDGSHRSFMNTDATVFFLEMVPRLPAGVLVHVHDIFLPDDYLPDWADRHYNEQYLLAAWLLGGSRGLQIELPAWFAHNDPELDAVARPLWTTLGLEGEATRGCSFWMRTV